MKSLLLSRSIFVPVPRLQQWWKELVNLSVEFFTTQLNINSYKKNESSSELDDLIAVKNTDSGIIFLDKNGRILKANTIMENMVGFTLAEMKGRKLTDFVFEKSASGDVHAATTWYALHQDGTQLAVTVKWMNFQSNRDPFTMAFISPLLEDKKSTSRLYDLRQINEHVKRRLKQKAEQLEQVVDKMKRIILDQQKEEGKKKRLEARFRKRKQLLKEVVRQFPDVSLFLWNERHKLKSLKFKDDASIDQSSFLSQELLEQLNKSLLGETVSAEIVNDDRVFSVVASPLQNEDGLIDYSLVIIRNISDRKILEKRISKVLGKEKELELLNSQSKLINVLSHKLRTPLSTILAAVFLLENYSITELNQEKDVLMEKVKRAVQTMTHLLNELDGFDGKEKVGKEVGLERKDPAGSTTPFLYVLKNNKDTDSLSNPT
jgi:PAS domain S-box-containing protein